MTMILFHKRPALVDIPIKWVKTHRLMTSIMLVTAVALCVLAFFSGEPGVIGAVALLIGFILFGGVAQSSYHSAASALPYAPTDTSRAEYVFLMSMGIELIALGAVLLLYALIASNL